MGVLWWVIFDAPTGVCTNDKIATGFGLPFAVAGKFNSLLVSQIVNDGSQSGKRRRISECNRYVGNGDRKGTVVHLWIIRWVVQAQYLTTELPSQNQSCRWIEFQLEVC